MFESQKVSQPKLLIVFFYVLFVCKCVLYFDRSHPVVFCKNTVIYLVNNTTYVLVISIKNSATCFDSLNHHQAKYQNTVLEHSASACVPSSTVFWYLAWWWFSEPKHVAEFLILITNICCVIDWENYYCVLYYCHRVSIQLKLTNISISIKWSNPLTSKEHTQENQYI